MTRNEWLKSGFKLGHINVDQLFELGGVNPPTAVTRKPRTPNPSPLTKIVMSAPKLTKSGLPRKKRGPNKPKVAVRNAVAPNGATAEA